MEPQEMNAATEIRLSELIYRTLKIRISLLLLLVLGLFLVLKAVDNGNPVVQQIDVEYCNKLISAAQQKALLPIDPANTCSPREARNYIELTVQLDAIMMPQGAAAAPALKQLGGLQDILEQYPDYATRRRDAFSMSISPPYAGGAVPVNALSLADLSPFCVPVVIAIVFALGLRQKCYERVLAAVVREGKSARDVAVSSSLAQFFAGTLRRSESRGRTFFIYGMSLSMLPENAAVVVLLIAAAGLFVKVVEDFDPTSIHPANSIFFSYYFVFFSTVAVLCWSLVRIRSAYAQIVSQQVGAPVRGFWSHRPLQIWEAAADGLESRRLAGATLGTVLSVIAALLGFAFFFLPWTQPRAFAGYQFVTSQKALPPIFTGIPVPTLYPIDPHVFREIRWQVLAALLFLLVAFSRALLSLLKRRTLAKSLIAVQEWLGYLIVFLAANYILYMIVLQYQSAASVSAAVRNFMFNADPMAPRGAPMMFFDPAYGFGGFVCCCAILVVLSEARKEAARRKAP